MKNLKLAFVNCAMASYYRGQKHVYVCLKGRWYTKEALEDHEYAVVFK